jgi:5-methylcytosine-specific restriction endonuclease McrA
MNSLDFSSADARIPARNRKALPKSLQLMIFQRDKWLCQSCKRPVIFSPAIKLLEADVKNDTEMKALEHTSKLAYYHAHGTRDGAPLLDELAASIDHKKPFSTGGKCTEDNLRTLCWKCNVRRGNQTEAAWDQQPKRKPVKGKHGEPKYWDGLASVFVMLADRNTNRLTAGEKEWLKAIKLSYSAAHA